MVALRCLASCRSCARTQPRFSACTRRRVHSIPGTDADIVLFDPALEHTLSAEAQHCLADFTMFEGKDVIGQPIMTMQRGEIIVENGVMHRPKGRAEYLPGNRDLAAYAPNGHKVM